MVCLNPKRIGEEQVENRVVPTQVICRLLPFLQLLFVQFVARLILTDLQAKLLFDKRHTTCTQGCVVRISGFSIYLLYCAAHDHPNKTFNCDISLSLSGKVMRIQWSLSTPAIQPKIKVYLPIKWYIDFVAQPCLNLIVSLVASVLYLYQQKSEP